MRLTFASIWALALCTSFLASLSGTATAASTPVISLSPYAAGTLPTTAVKCPVTVNFQAGVSVSNWPAKTPFTYQWTLATGTGKPAPVGQPLTLNNEPNAFVVAPAPAYAFPISASNTYTVGLQVNSALPAGSKINPSPVTFTVVCIIAAPGPVKTVK